MSEYTIVCRDLTCAYGGVDGITSVLSGLDLTVTSNQILVVLGVNGSGKTTLLKAIAGLVDPISGFAGVESDRVSVGSPSERPVIAFLHQNYRQTNLPWASVLANVAYPLRFKGLGQIERNSLAAEVLHTFLPEVGHDRKAYELSGGQQQLLAIARGAAAQPDVMLGDEPLSAADSVRGKKAVGTLEEAWLRDPFPLVWVSHDIDEAIMLGDDIALLSTHSQGIAKCIKNPIERPRAPGALAGPTANELRSEILDFLLRESEWTPSKSDRFIEAR